MYLSDYWRKYPPKFATCVHLWKKFAQEIPPDISHSPNNDLSKCRFYPLTLSNFRCTSFRINIYRNCFLLSPNSYQAAADPDWLSLKFLVIIHCLLTVFWWGDEHINFDWNTDTRVYISLYTYKYKNCLAREVSDENNFGYLRNRAPPGGLYRIKSHHVQKPFNWCLPIWGTPGVRAASSYGSKVELKRHVWSMSVLWGGGILGKPRRGNSDKTI